MEKRGQAATEFLTTYGWMILILIIVVAALGAFNIFKPNLPNKCDSAEPIFCSDVKLSSISGPPSYGDLRIVLSASGTSIKNPPDLRAKATQANITSPQNLGCTVVTTSDADVIPTDTQKIIAAQCNGLSTSNKGKRFTGTATVVYYLRETENLANPVQHTKEITFSGTIE